MGAVIGPLFGAVADSCGPLCPGGGCARPGFVEGRFSQSGVGSGTHRAHSSSAPAAVADRTIRPGCSVTMSSSTYVIGPIAGGRVIGAVRGHAVWPGQRVFIRQVRTGTRFRRRGDRRV